MEVDKSWQKKAGELGWVIPDWPAPAQVNAVCTTRKGGFSATPYDSMNLGHHVGDNGLIVASNRHRLGEILQLPSEPFWLEQVHGITVVTPSPQPLSQHAVLAKRQGRGAIAVPQEKPPLSQGGCRKRLCHLQNPSPQPLSPKERGYTKQTLKPPRPQQRFIETSVGEGVGGEGGSAFTTPSQGEGVGGEGSLYPQADAAVAHKPAGVCVVMTADCLPVLFCNQAGTRVAAAHAGWRGLCNGVLEQTIAALDCPAQEILAWLGPAIGPEQFEVGAEVREAFMGHDVQAANAFVPGDQEGKWLADIYELARQRLQAVGLTKISGGGFCTVQDKERFYSYRREKQTGRMASLIWLSK